MPAPNSVFIGPLSRRCCPASSLSWCRRSRSSRLPTHFTLHSIQALFLLAVITVLSCSAVNGHVLMRPSSNGNSHNENNHSNHLPSSPPLSPNNQSNNNNNNNHHNHINHNSNNSQSQTNAATANSHRNFSFPPETCKEDLDCIGRNASSRIFHDPNGRCNRVKHVCQCREGFKKMQFKVKQRGRRTVTNSLLALSSNNNNNQSAPIYVQKCVQEGSGSHHQSSIPFDELDVFLRSLHYYGQTCDEDKQCATNLICRQLVPSAAISRNLISPPSNESRSLGTSNGTSIDGYPKQTNYSSLMANRTKRCRCPIGQHWNKHNRRCEWSYSNTYGILHGSGNVRIDSDSMPSLSGSLPNTVQLSSTNIDLKIFEIVLEIAFLVACLLGYKACSQICCKEDSNENGSEACTYTSSADANSCDQHAEVKSDEESIISASIPVIKSIAKSPNTKSTGTRKKSTSTRVSRKRKVSRFCSRSRRSTSPYSLQTPSLLFSSSSNNFRRLSSVSASMSRSSSISTRNLLVKINPDDIKRLSVSTTLAPQSRTSSPCYNCRIYKEVYSPSARCKSCRTSLLSVASELNAADIVNESGTATGHPSISPTSITAVGTLSGTTGNGHSNHHHQSSKANTMLEFDSLLVIGDSSAILSPDKKSTTILPLPPYKQKPIRRSEEVGVPPHLRAPYRDTKPFWLK